MQPTRIHSDKNPPHRHYIAEWAAHRSLKKADVARETGADKSLVTRWFSGTVPGDDYLEKLAGLFGTTREGLFHDPVEDWVFRFFRDRKLSEADKNKAREMLTVMFPTRTGTDPNK